MDLPSLVATAEFLSKKKVTLPRADLVRNLSSWGIVVTDKKEHLMRFNSEKLEFERVYQLDDLVTKLTTRNPLAQELPVALI